MTSSENEALAAWLDLAERIERGGTLPAESASVALAELMRQRDAWLDLAVLAGGEERRVQVSAVLDRIERAIAGQTRN